jgi:hypothetical protein
MASIFRGNLTIFILCIFVALPVIGQEWYQSYLFSEKTVLQNEVYHNSAIMIPEIESVQPATKKSVFSAFLLSLALPGLGEAYVGESHYTRIFLSTEIIGWGLYISNEIQVQNREKQYKNYAVQHAGIIPQDKNIQYWIDIGKFDSIYEYNEQSRRNRDIAAIYSETHQNFWSWDDEANRKFYEWQRIRTREIERREIYYIGGIVLNHLVSAINALRLARAYNRNQAELSWRLDFDFYPTGSHMQLSLVKPF